jgi:CheY-like chemotaxis protein
VTLCTNAGYASGMGLNLVCAVADILSRPHRFDAEHRFESAPMNLQASDLLLPLLVAGVFGLGAGLGLSALAKGLWQRGAVLWRAYRAPSWPSTAPDRLPRPSGATQHPSLPRTPHATAAAAIQRWSAKPSLPQVADLLLVDDSAVARAKLKKLFAPAGYAMHFANDGVEALALLKTGRYALMITDLEMPNMDGITLINTCLANPITSAMPILAITGHDHLRAKFNQCRDICGIHRKPWVDDILLSHVAAIVTQRMPQTAQQTAQQTAEKAASIA